MLLVLIDNFKKKSYQGLACVRQKYGCHEQLAFDANVCDQYYGEHFAGVLDCRVSYQRAIHYARAYVELNLV